MSDVGDAFRAYRSYCAKKRTDNKEKSTKLLQSNGIEFKSKNDGSHLIIEHNGNKINFYPATGLYNGAVSGRGVMNLLAVLKNEVKNEKNERHCDKRMG